MAALPLLHCSCHAQKERRKINTSTLMIIHDYIFSIMHLMARFIWAVLYCMTANIMLRFVEQRSDVGVVAILLPSSHV